MTRLALILEGHKLVLTVETTAQMTKILIYEDVCLKNFTNQQLMSSV